MARAYLAGLLSSYRDVFMNYPRGQFKGTDFSCHSPDCSLFRFRPTTSNLFDSSSFVLRCTFLLLFVSKSRMPLWVCYHPLDDMIFQNHRSDHLSEMMNGQQGTFFSMYCTELKQPLWLSTCRLLTVRMHMHERLCAVLQLFTPHSCSYNTL